MATKFEYNTGVLPFDPGPKGTLTATLNRAGAEGWELVSCHLVPMAEGAAIVDAAGKSIGQAGMGLVVILRRVLGEGPAKPPAAGFPKFG